MKTCPRCGATCADNDRFCPNCGNPMPEHTDSAQADAQGPRYEQPRYEQGPVYQGGRRPPRSVALAIVLSIITCGIYGIYWAYKMGQNCACLNGDSSGSILYLLLALFGFQIINLALFQDMINKCA